MFIFLLILVLIVGFVIFKKLKFPKTSCVTTISGDVKTGKSTFGLALAKVKYNFILLKWKIGNFFRKLFRKPLKEKPLFYSNIPVGFDYVELTEELLNRQQRFRYGSVVFVDEANLLADSTSALGNDLKTKSQNERIAVFTALFGHETHGGYLFYTCHNLDRLHYGIRDTCSQYFFIHSLIKWLPFFIVARVEERVSGRSDTINVRTEDIESTLKLVLIRKKVWKYFDAYCYSVLTDDLPVADKIIEGKKLPNLKAHYFLSFKNWHDEFLSNYFKKFNSEVKNEKEND